MTVYDAPLDAATQLGWVLAAVTLAVLAARAVAVERRARAGSVTARPSGRARWVHGALGLLSAVAVVTLVVVLGVVVAAGLDR